MPITDVDGPATNRGWHVRDLLPAELGSDAVRGLMHLACGFEGARLDAVIREELPALTVTAVVPASGPSDGAPGPTSDALPIALAAFRPAGSDGSPAVIEYLATAPRHQHEGLASLLIDEVRRRHPKAAVIAETDDDAIGFYRTLGFADEPATDPRWPDTPRYRCTLAPAGC